jgi:hypothetical protein
LLALETNASWLRSALIEDSRLWLFAQDAAVVDRCERQKWGEAARRSRRHPAFE